jgi:hypothetical protein
LLPIIIIITTNAAATTDQKAGFLLISLITGDAKCRALILTFWGVPHTPQNLALSGNSVPQFWQIFFLGIEGVTPITVPHTPQNFALSGICAPQLLQRFFFITTVPHIPQNAAKSGIWAPHF